MSVLFEPYPAREASARSLAAVVAVLLGCALGFVLLTAPLGH